jgi:uncharacterized membrane-anchored protein YhcB (DUF1043 family)
MENWNKTLVTFILSAISAILGFGISFLTWWLTHRKERAEVQKDSQLQTLRSLLYEIKDNIRLAKIKIEEQLPDVYFSMESWLGAQRSGNLYFLGDKINSKLREIYTRIRQINAGIIILKFLNFPPSRAHNEEQASIDRLNLQAKMERLQEFIKKQKEELLKLMNEASKMLAQQIANVERRKFSHRE